MPKKKRIYRNDIIGKPDDARLSKKENERLRSSRSKNTYYELDPIDEGIAQAKAKESGSKMDSVSAEKKKKRSQIKKYLP